MRIRAIYMVQSKQFWVFQVNQTKMKEETFVGSLGALILTDFGSLGGGV